MGRPRFMPTSVIAILNPRAAGGKTRRAWPKISRLFQAHAMQVEPRWTEQAGHAIALTRQALEQGARLVVAIGGDGTANEVVNGFFDNDQPINPEAAIGFIPIGTGGDLQRTLELPSDLEQAVEIIAAGKRAAIDVGKVRLRAHDGSPAERYFVNLVSFGMGGDVSVRAKNFLSPLNGKAAFLYATLVEFVRYRGRKVRLTLDGNALPEPFFITNIAIGNGRYHGGGMHPCPRAVMNDGLLEVTTIDHLSMYELIRDLPVLYSDNIYKHPKVRHFHAKTVLAESEEITRAEVDGEALGRLPMEVTLLPRALTWIVAAGSALAVGHDASLAGHPS
jgi:YegS/Rv2252/BmrU family lipid kinase